MDATEFQKEYYAGKTWGDASKLVDKMSDENVRELKDAMIVVQKYTGLDMRQEFFLGMLRAEEKNREEKADGN
ncbi:MAG: hypothetical protein PHI12_07935 [Dehalococcoidales bacterium]|jgi:hypothetical protein|nr:hypothetical protein [Sphaerochaeta sp.]MDD5510723.1 hypothetical protein [Dehalococcoidales bacterium]